MTEYISVCLPNGGGNGGGKSVIVVISSSQSERSLRPLRPSIDFRLELRFSFFCSFFSSKMAWRLRSLDLSKSFLVSTR